MINKLRNKLTSWKNHHISFGGRICSIRDVLSSLPLFYLSFFKAPSKVIHSFIQFREISSRELRQEKEKYIGSVGSRSIHSKYTTALA